jgi:hypothetical protein
MLVSTSRSVPRRLGLLAIPSAVRDNVVGQRLRQRQPEGTWPAAGRDGDSNMAKTSRCGTTSEDGTGDFFGLLVCWRRLVQGGSNRMISIHYGGLRLDFAHGGRAPPRATLMAILETSTERGAVRWFWRSPRTRELLRTRCSSYRPVVSWGAIARRRWVLHGDGPFGMVVLAPNSLVCGGFYFSGFRYLQECGLWVEVLFCFVSSVVVVSRVLAVLMSQSNRSVRIVVRQPVLISQSNRTSLFFLLFLFPIYDLPGPYSCIFFYYIYQ